MEYLVITAQAPQSVDIWLKISKLANDTGCQISHAQGQKLAGENALLMMISGNWNTVAKFETGLKQLSAGKNIHIHKTRSKPIEDQAQLMPYYVEVLGVDELGILFQICQFFANQHVHIENLKLESYTSNITHTPMFSLKVSLSIPAKINIGDLREQYILFCEELNIDGALEPEKR